MWIDATVAASFVTNPDDSTVADKCWLSLWHRTAEGVEKRANWLWAWALAIPAGTQQAEAEAKQFIEWATSQATISNWLRPRAKAGQTYLRVHGSSLYENPELPESCRSPK